MCAAYAFARRVDDIGDGDLTAHRIEACGTARSSSPASAAAGARWRRGSCRPERPGHDGAGARAAALRLPPDALELLIEGVERDVLGAEYETFDELVRYCRCVAGSVGRLCLAIFSDGRADERRTRSADDLGVAMQLTNILRDIVEDRGLGRMYLPAEDRRRFGCTRPAPGR